MPAKAGIQFFGKVLGPGFRLRYSFGGLRPQPVEALAKTGRGDEQQDWGLNASGQCENQHHDQDHAEDS